MAVVEFEYSRLYGLHDSFILERTHNKNRLYRANASKSSLTKASLEDEIRSLRRKMENHVSQGNSLTSELVVQISTLLDEKINEYMRVSKKS